MKTQTQATDEMAKSFTDLGEFQQKRSQMMVEAHIERQAEFLKIQREPAELNRLHELKMMELLMKITNIHPSAHYQHAATTDNSQLLQQCHCIWVAAAVPPTTSPIPSGSFSGESSH